MNKKAIVLGASPKKDRYSNMAIHKLQEKGYEIYPVNPFYPQIDGIDVCKNLADAPEAADILTVYLNPVALQNEVDGIIALKPSKVIFNPGTENPAIMEKLSDAGIMVQEACTLVLCSTGQL